MRLRLWLTMIGLLLGLQSAGAVTLTKALTTTAISDAQCNPGPAASTFLTTDVSVFLYVSISGGAAGDRLRVDWVSPDGIAYASGSFPALPSGGSYCFDDGIDVAGAPAAERPGNWTIKGYWNSVPLFTINFTLSQPGGGGGSGVNLIVNPGAESGPGTPDCQSVTAVPGWIVAGGPAICQYGAAEIPATAPGPVDRGTNFFSGGPTSGVSSLKQTISLISSGTLIDAGNLSFTLSGWFGGWSNQNDNAQLTITFKTAADVALATGVIGPVSAADRNSVTGLLFKTKTGTVPVNTRNIDVELLFNRTEGTYNDGAADNLSLVLGGGTTTSSGVYYRFENGTANATPSGTGTILDSFSPGQNGTPSGALTYSTDVPAATIPLGGAANLLSLSFTATGKVQFAGTFPLNTLPNATLEFWIKPTGTGSMDSLWTRTDSSDANRFNMEMQGSGATRTLFLDYREVNGTLHGLSAGVPVAANAWTHVAFVKTGNVWTSYGNGVQQGQPVTDASANLPTNTGWTFNGRGTAQFTGLLDEFRISDSALTPSQFLNAGSGGGGGSSCTLGSASNLLGNGSFELPGGASTVFLGSGTSNATFMPCWTVTSGSVDYIGTLWPASDGNNSVDMAGLSAGAITQTFATTPGTKYTVSFDLAANPSGGTQIKILEVSAAGQSQTFTVNPSVNPPSSTGWLRGRTFSFTANSASTTLQLASLDGVTSYGPALDNVCVIAGASPCTGGGGGGGTGTILSISLSPATGTSASGSQHTVTATVVDQNSAPQANVAVTFTILSGPNQGATGVCGPTNCKTGANGQVTFTYTGTRGAGVDSITACIDTGTSTLSDCCTEKGVNQLSKAADPASSATPSKRTAAKSSSVVIIGAATVDPNCSSGANRIGNGGCLPVSGAATELGAFTFAGMAPTAVTTAALAAYDTAVLNMGASGISCDMTKLPAQAKSDLVTYVGGGKKLIIYDSECQTAGNKGLDYSWLPYPFTTANPGALGAQGTLNIVENSTLGSAITGSTYFIDAANLSNNSDAVGDMNVMTTKDAHWCLALSGTNALKVTGPVHAYAKYPGGTDSGLFIYNGLDQDDQNNVGNANLRKLWYFELLQAFNPSGLPCGVAVVGITSSVTTSTPAVGAQVTVTARVVDQLGQAQANVPVTFTVTGINAAATVVCNPSTCRTDSNGQVTFTYPGTKGAGTDSVQACFTPTGSTSAVCAPAITITWGQGGGGPACATPVTKTWTAGGAVCNYFVQPLTNIGVPAAGTRNGFLQIFTGLACKWGAVSNDSWITIIAGASGTGSPGAVSYSVAPNTTSSPRTGTISITDGSGVVQTHTVIQLPGGPPCTFGLSPLSGGAPASGGGGAFLLSTGTGCYWIAVPNDPWIHVTPNSGYGSQLLNYNADVNPTTSGRSGTIGVMGQTFTVFQGAPAPAVQPGTPLITSGGIVNAASSRGGPIARGSFFTIYGADIGPTVPTQATSYPLPDTMGGVVVTIAQGSVTKRAILHFVSSTQINGIVPSDSPLGDVQVTVTFNGKLGVSSTATLVDTSFGIFSAGSGVGPGIIQNWNSPTDVVLNLPTIPGKPQQLAILWGTGLGPVNIADNNKPPVGDLSAPVIVEVAGLTAQVVYHGRAPDFAGVDNVYFYVPQGVPEGCSVPVRIKAGPTWSNTVRMAIRGGSGPCQDLANPNSSLSNTGGKIGTVIMMRAELSGQFQANQAPANATLDLGLAMFTEIKAGGQLAFSSTLNLPPVGSCASNTKGLDFTSLLGGDILSSADTTVNRQLDAGSKITITGAKGSADLSPLGSNAGTYMGLLGGTAPLAGAASTPLFLDPKTVLSVSSSGGKDVGPISGSVTLPSSISWTNRDQINTVNRSTPLTITWSGGDPGQMMVVAGGAADSKTKTSGGFFCLVQAGLGTFTVPVSILADLPVTRPMTGGGDDTFGGIGLVAVPGLPTTFNATGLDSRIIMTGSASIKTVQIQ